MPGGKPNIPIIWGDDIGITNLSCYSDGLMRPGRIPAGEVRNGIVAHNDWFPTLLAAAGNPDITEQLLNGTELAGETCQSGVVGSDVAHAGVASQQRDLRQPERRTGKDPTSWIFSTD